MSSSISFGHFFSPFVLFLFSFHGVVPLILPPPPFHPTYCCHCLQPWQQPKTIQGLQQVNIAPPPHAPPPQTTVASQIYIVRCWIWIWVKTHHDLRTAWAKPSPCMDAHTADASCSCSSHVSGCISNRAICLGYQRGFFFLWYFCFCSFVFSWCVRIVVKNSVWVTGLREKWKWLNLTKGLVNGILWNNM